MKKITWKQQLCFGVVIIIIANLLAIILHKGIFCNIAWIIYGFVCILHPVYPEKYNDNVKRAKLGVRIVGIIFVLIGLLIRYIP